VTSPICGPMKVEPIHSEMFGTREAMRRAVVENIEVDYKG